MPFFESFKKSKPPLKNLFHEVTSLEDDLMKELSQNSLEDEMRYPQDVEYIRRIERNLRSPIYEHVEKMYPKDIPDRRQPMKVEAATTVFLSDDRMSAYLCFLPPLYGGPDMTFDKAFDDIHFEGVTQGIDEAFLRKIIEEKMYLHIVPIARGTPPTDGVDERIEDFFERRSLLQMEAPEGATIDFNEDNLIQAVRKGEVICRIVQGEPFQHGTDVRGRMLRAKPGTTATLPAGKHTVVSQNEQFLIAEIDGAVCIRENLFCVERRHVVFDDIEASMGALDYPGELLIKGDIHDGAKITASGNIVIEGTVGSATIISGGSIHIQRGIRAQRAGSIQATVQVQCKFIEECQVVAGGSVFAEAIISSNVTAGESVCVLGGRGLIAGGQIKARKSVSAKRIGNQSSSLNLIILNYNPSLKNEAAEVHKELQKTQGTLDDLCKTIQLLRGKMNHTQENRALLERLMEQRDFYEEQVAQQTKWLQYLKAQINNVVDNWLKCDEILPTTVIRIGDKSHTIRTKQNKCNVHMELGSFKER